jgi:hypothetical protein
LTFMIFYPIACWNNLEIDHDFFTKSAIHNHNLSPDAKSAVLLMGFEKLPTNRRNCRKGTWFAGWSGFITMPHSLKIYLLFELHVLARPETSCR